MKQDMTIKWLESVDSTQDEIHRHLEALANLSVVAARCQTAGRGQRGNRWATRPGENLTFSLLLKPGQDGLRSVPVSDQFQLSEVTALAVQDTLSDYGIPARIKWPNDIYVGDRKICGMLIENQLRGRQIVSSIIGVGLNVNQLSFDPDLMNPTSMARQTGRQIPVEEVLASFLVHFLSTWEEDRPVIRERFQSHLYRLEECHSYTDCSTGTVFDGTIKGISKRGLLRVEMPDGTIREFAFKEISYII